MKEAQWMDIRSDRQKGLSYVELGGKYHMDPRTAKRYAESPYSALRILEKLREMGFDRGYSIVKAYVSSRKMDEKATVRFETMPRKQGQMEWGFFEDYLVYEDGKWKKLYCSLENGENVVFLGPPGVGKTHLASALRLVAAQHRFSTYYVNCHQLIARRYEKTSTVFTSNKTFSQWNEVFADVTIASAILDRVLHHCTVINIKGESYRLHLIFVTHPRRKTTSFLRRFLTISDWR